MIGTLSTTRTDFTFENMTVDRLQLFMIFWDKSGVPMGRMVSRMENIEQALEIALANETDIAHLDGIILSPWAWFP
jgi:hypothetical protein